MNLLLYQLMNMLLVIALLGAPVAVALIMLKHFNKKENMMEMEARLTARISELEEKVEKLEELQ